MAYTDTSNIVLHMPVPGSREPAQIALLNENCVALDAHDHGTGKGLAVGRLRSGLQANRPAAGTAGNVYFATDTGQFYVDTGTAWVQFITSGGQATVSGWTLIDPIVRDTLQFAPEPTGAVDTTITRTGADSLQFGKWLGLASPPLTGQHADWASFRIGNIGLLRADFAANGQTVVWGCNSYYGSDLKGKSIIAGGAFQQVMSPTQWVVYSAASVAAQAEQSMQIRLQMYLNGNLISTPSANTDAGFQTPANIAMSVATYTPWRSDLRAIQLGDAAAIYFQPPNGHVWLGANLRVGADGSSRAIATGQSAQLQITAGGLNFGLAPSTPAGGTHTIVNRFQIDGNGTAFVTPVDGVRPVVQLQYTNPNSPEGRQLVFADLSNGWRSYIGTTYPAAALQLESTSGAVLIKSATSNVSFGTQASGYVHPITDNSTNLGHPSVRWGTVYAVVGAINTSHVSLKENFAPLDPAACAEAVLGTDWLSFDYKPPAYAPPPLPDGLPEEEQATMLADSRARYEQSVLDTAPGRKQRGYVLGSEEYTTADLFGMADRTSASTQADLGVVACALQDALRRIAALEARDATAA